MSDLFNIRKQLTFYGAYHSNPVNVCIHMICVPILVWSGQVLIAHISTPTWVPSIHHDFTPYLAFDLNWTTIISALYQLYYICLEPVAGLLYLPQFTISLLTATSFSTKASSSQIAALLHAIAWVAQFIGHGVHEKRAPALLDNILGAVVLAPFFVHLELLFKVGYAPQLHKDVQNSIGKEIAKLKKEQGDQKRAAQET